ncbi:MAG: YtrH family sporulation protein [Bacillota bacterium]
MTVPSQLVDAYFIALGVVTDGSLVGALGRLLTGGMPMAAVSDLTERLKLWAVLAALGGTFATLKTLETGLLGGHLMTVAHQMSILASAFLGAHSGYIILTSMVRGE